MPTDSVAKEAVAAELANWSPTVYKHHSHFVGKFSVTVDGLRKPFPGQPTLFGYELTVRYKKRNYRADVLFDAREPIFLSRDPGPVIRARADCTVGSILERIDRPRVAAEAAAYLAEV